MSEGAEPTVLTYDADVKIEIEKCKRERGRRKKANKDRFWTMIGKRSNCDSITLGLDPGPPQHTTQQQPEEVARPTEALEVINHFNLKPVKIQLTLSPSLC